MSHALQQVSNSVSLAQLTRLAQMTGFQKIALLNNLAGNLTNGGWEAADAQIKLIKSEFRELCEDGVEARNIHEVRDGIADMLVVIYGLAHRLGIDADADLHEVVLSNLTKFDPSDTTDVQRTVAKYLNVGVETVQLEVDDPLRDEGSDRKLYVSKSAYDQNGTDGKNYPKGKWLKSANFVEPEFAPLKLHVQEKLGLVTVHRNLGSHGFGIFQAPGEGGYYVRAIESFTVGETTVNKDDLIFINDRHVEAEDLNPSAPTIVADPDDDGRTFAEVAAENLAGAAQPLVSNGAYFVAEGDQPFDFSTISTTPEKFEPGVAEHDRSFVDPQLAEQLAAEGKGFVAIGGGQAYASHDSVVNGTPVPAGETVTLDN